MGHGNQKLHGHMRRDSALAHVLLDSFGKKLDQRQPPQPCRMPGLQMLPTPIELVKLQLHGPAFRVGNQYAAGWNWSFAERTESFGMKALPAFSRVGLARSPRPTLQLAERTEIRVFGMAPKRESLLIVLPCYP
jgi:hypothetical protein